MRKLNRLRDRCFWSKNREQCWANIEAVIGDRRAPRVRLWVNGDLEALMTTSRDEDPEGWDQLARELQWEAEYIEAHDDTR